MFKDACVIPGSHFGILFVYKSDGFLPVCHNWIFCTWKVHMEKTLQCASVIGCLISITYLLGYWWNKQCNKFKLQSCTFEGIDIYLYCAQYLARWHHVQITFYSFAFIIFNLLVLLLYIGYLHIQSLSSAFCKVQGTNAFLVLP